jgi:hypothetical protein
MKGFRVSDFPELNQWENRRLQRRERRISLDTKRDDVGLNKREKGQYKRLKGSTMEQTMMKCAEDPLFAVISRRPRRRGQFQSKV